MASSRPAFFLQFRGRQGYDHHLSPSTVQSPKSLSFWPWLRDWCRLYRLYPRWESLNWAGPSKSERGGRSTDIVASSFCGWRKRLVPRERAVCQEVQSHDTGKAPKKSPLVFPRPLRGWKTVWQPVYTKSPKWSIPTDPQFLTAPIRAGRVLP